MSETIFLQLFERALSLDEAFPVDLNSRWIKRKSEMDAALMAKADIDPIKLSMFNAAALIRHMDTTYFGVSGFEEPDSLPPGLAPVDSTPGLFASFVVALQLDATATAAEIRDVISDFSAAESDYEGHELNLISALFPRIYFYEVDTNYGYALSIDRIVGSYVARGYGRGPLRLSKQTKYRMAEFFESGPDSIPYDLPLRGLLAFAWTNLFTELYRCIEQMYSIPRIVRLTQLWESKENIREISRILEDTLSWRPKEDESLEFLFESLDANVCRAIWHSIRLPSRQEAKASPSKAAAKRVYALRNACVHFRPATQFHNINDRDWNNIAVSMLEAVRKLYHLHGERFYNPPVAGTGMAPDAI